MNARNRMAVADLDFNKLGHHKCDSRRRKPYTNRRKSLLVEGCVSDRSNYLDFEETCVGMLFDIHDRSWCPLTALSMFYCSCCCLLFDFLWQEMIFSPFPSN